MKKILIIFLSFLLSGCSLLSNIQYSIDSKKQEQYIENIIDHNTKLDYQNHYFLKQLSDIDLAFVIKVYEGMMNFDETIEINLPFSSQNRPLELLELLQDECPELYQFTTNGSNNNVVCNWILNRKELVSIEMSYLMSKEEYNDSLDIINTEIQNIEEIVKDYSDFDKEMYAYNYIVDHCQYNEKTNHYSSPYGVFIESQAACLGIARTMQWIMNECGIECMTIGGYTEHKQSGHAWNIIKLDNEYYSVDPTSDTNRLDDDKYKMYLYFNVTDNEIRNNYTLQSCLKNVPETTGTKYNYFTYTNHFVSENEDAQTKINALLTQSYFNNQKECSIKIENKDVYDTIVNNVSSIYNNWLLSCSLSFIPCSFANSDEYQVIYFQFQY
ncbi:transglutaminase domain-containing protein [Floccifex sp.]|uniref:transglutaminase domain-containing protein n=1 Tax=Floccifex sp. TaxID=2815810 RepID=UPI003F111B9E